MKKSIGFLFLIVSIFCSSLTSEAKFGFGPIVEFTGTLVNAKKKDMLEKKFSSRFEPGFSVGLMGEFIGDNIFGVDFAVKYTKEQSSIDIGYGFHNLTGSFIEIPVHLKAVNIIGNPDKAGAYVSFGPNFSIPVASNELLSKSKKMHIGADIGVGVKLIRHLYIGCNFTLGINKINVELPVTDDIYNSTHHVKISKNDIRLSAAWMF